MKSSLILGLLGSASLLLSNTATAQQDAPRAKEQRIVVKKNTQKQAGQQSEKRAELLAEASKLNKKAAELTEAGDLDGAVKASRKAANLLQQASRLSQQSERKQQREVRVRARAEEARDAAETERVRARDQAEALRIRVEAEREASDAYRHAADAHRAHVEALRGEVAGKLNVVIDGSEIEVPELAEGRYIININGEAIEYDPEAGEALLQRYLDSAATVDILGQDLTAYQEALDQVEGLDLAALGHNLELQNLEGLAQVLVMKDGELIEGLSGLEGMAIDLSDLTTDLAEMNIEFDGVEMDWTELSGEINSEIADAWGRIEVPEGVWQHGENHVFVPGQANTGEWIMDRGEHAQFFLRNAEGGQFMFDPSEHEGVTSIWSGVMDEECAEQGFFLNATPELSGDRRHVIIRTHVTGPEGLERLAELGFDAHEHGHDHGHDHGDEHEHGVFTFDGNDNVFESECEEVHVFGGEDGMHRIIIQGGHGTQNITIHGAIHGSHAPQAGAQERRIMLFDERAEGQAVAPRVLQRLRLDTPHKDMTKNESQDALLNARYRVLAPTDASGNFSAEAIPLPAPVAPGEMQDAKQLIEEMRAEMESLRQELSDLRKQLKDDPLVQAQRRPSLLPSDKLTDAVARARFREGAARLASGR